MRKYLVILEEAGKLVVFGEYSKEEEADEASIKAMEFVGKIDTLISQGILSTAIHDENHSTIFGIGHQFVSCIPIGETSILVIELNTHFDIETYLLLRKSIRKAMAVDKKFDWYVGCS